MRKTCNIHRQRKISQKKNQNYIFKNLDKITDKIEISMLKCIYIWNKLWINFGSLTRNVSLSLSVYPHVEIRSHAVARCAFKTQCFSVLNINEPLYTFTRASGIRVRALLFLTLSSSQVRFTKPFFGTRSKNARGRASLLQRPLSSYEELVQLLAFPRTFRYTLMNAVKRGRGKRRGPGRSCWPHHR